MRGPHPSHGFFRFMADVDLTQTIVDNATSPNSVTFDGQSVTNNSIEGQIAAQKFLGANDALTGINAGTKWFARVRVNAQGAGGDEC